MTDRRRLGRNRYWTDERIESELRLITGALGSFPTASELRGLGLNDLCCGVTKAGGLIAWAERLGIARKHSDSDTGWDGERAVQSLFHLHGIDCVRCHEVKSPYDLLAADVLRIDVKSARYATHGAGSSHESAGWFYRLGKHVQADLVILYQLDEGGFYALPWWVGPTTNITITVGGGKYAHYAGDWHLIERMIRARQTERELDAVCREVPAA